MKFFIPSIKDSFIILQDWNFILHKEYRNDTFMSAYSEIDSSLPNKYNNGRKSSIFLPKGTRLIVDRIYIRKGAPDYDSLTFVIDDCKFKKLNRQRFWANLQDVNNLQIDPSSIIKNYSLKKKDPVKYSKNKTLQSDLEYCRKIIQNYLDSIRSHDFFSKVQNNVSAHCQFQSEILKKDFLEQEQKCAKHHVYFLQRYHDDFSLKNNFNIQKAVEKFYNHLEHFKSDFMRRAHHSLYWTAKPKRTQKDQTFKRKFVISHNCWQTKCSIIIKVDVHYDDKKVLNIEILS